MNDMNQMTANPSISADQQRDRARIWFESLRDRICAEIETLEREAPAELFPGDPATFTYKPWTRATGTGGGIGGFLSGGRLFEKIGIHTSSANGRLTPEMAKTMPGDGEQLDYVSTSISLIMHPRSPRVPTVHMNTRFLSTAQGWFGGGADLTPMLAAQRTMEAPDTVAFHAAMRVACNAHDPAYYDKFKAWADSYFYLPHRGTARGVGGIFYDHLNSGDFDRDFAFTRDVGSAFLDVYPKIVRARMMERWTEAERAEQLAIRGLYVEFNLLYDKGTMFGLQTGGNIETILSSMPPLVSWS
ncbi:oxygen-dependent coproporphyrinogen oxidase [Tardiphaga sp.]|uniref:oxygen-dependent coproporphyrinogen oxidase n=1 Tax=Tardiphaga sp. TaxID=1926292 RepID=UPI00260BB161|nr:oxygen-dependent coproporphyrinogen oxidase [Tardiphaga sp.]MDB5618724.1 coproporphyrinogen oxidase [Tardiphaga sp.]